jgi:uncharacterized membrane protein
MSEKSKIIIILVFFGLVYSSISLVNHYTFKTYAWDLGIKNNELYDYAHFRWNHNTLLYPAPDNKLGNHFSLYLFFVSPFYWIFKSWTLLIFQILMILFGGLGTYRYFKNRFNKGSPLPFLSMIFFFSLWGIYSAVGFDYHDNVVAAMFLPWLLLAWDKHDLKLFITFSVLMIIGKENISIWLIFIGISLLITGRKDKWKRKAGLSLSLGSAIYLILIMSLIVPALAGETGYRHFHYSTLGENVPSAVITIIRKPFYVFSLFWADQGGNTETIKLELHAITLLSGGLFLVLKPSFIIMLIPIYAQKLFNVHTGKWGIDYHYSIEFVPILTFASFTFLSEIKNNNKVLIALLCLLLAAFTSYKSLGKHANQNHQEQNYQFLSKKHYSTVLDYFKVKKALDNIPEDASVCAQNTLVPHLAFRDTIHVFPLMFKTTDFIVLADQRIPVFPASDHGYFDSINYVMNSGSYDFFEKRDGITIFKKTDNLNINLVEVYDTLALELNYEDTFLTKEFIGFGRFELKKGDFFKARVLLVHPPDDLTFTAKSISNKSIYFDTRESNYKNGYYEMVLEGGPAFHKKKDTLTIYLWNRGNNPVDFYEFTLLNRKYIKCK